MNDLARDFLRFRDRGDSDALARVFDALAPRLLLIAGHLTRDAARAEDLVQETFLGAMRDARRYDGARPLAAWLAAILRHRAIDARRRDDVRASASLEASLAEAVSDDAPEPDRVAADAELFDNVVAAVLALDEPYRAVLNLRVVHGLSPTAIAHALGRKPGTVRMQLKRGLDELRQTTPMPAALWLAFGDGARGLGAVREAVLANAAPPAAASPSDAASPIDTASPADAASPAGPSAAAPAQPATAAGTLAWNTWVAWVGAAALFGVVALLGVLARAGLRDDPTLADVPRDVAAAPAGSDATPLRGAPVPSDVEDGARELAPNRAPDGLVAVVEPALEVVVTFAADGAPAGGVGVYLRRIDAGGLGREARADASGVARFEPDAPGLYEVHLDRTSEVARVRWPEERLLAVAIPAGLDVRGRVVDFGGDPVGGAKVFRRNERHHDALQALAVADSAGRFSLHDVEDEIELLARAAGHQPSSLEGLNRVRRGDEVELRLGATGHPIAGRVLRPDGAPAAFARVLIGVDEDAREAPEGSPRMTDNSGDALDREGILLRADGEGRFASDEVPGGNAVVIARPAEDDADRPWVGWATRRVSLVAGEPGDTRALSIALRPGAEVSGVVRDPTGAPVAGIAVEAEWEGTVELGEMEDDLGPFFSDRRTRTAPDGSYRLDALLPGEYDLRVRGAREELAFGEHDLAPGERAVWDPVVDAPATLVVRLVDADGAPVSGWGVAVDERVPTLRRMRAVRTAADGRASVGDLPVEEDLFVAAFPPADDADWVQLPAALRSGVRVPRGKVAREFELRLADVELPTAGVRGRVVDGSGAGARRATLLLRRAGLADGGPEWRRSADADGAFAFGALAPGELVLRAETAALPGGVEVARFALAPGRTLDLGELVLPMSTELTVTVRAADGAELGNLAVELASLDDRAEGTLVERFRRDGDAFTARAPVGHALLRVQGGPFAAWAEPIALPPGGARADVVLHPAPRSTVRVAMPRLDGAMTTGRLTVRDANGIRVVDEDAWISFGADVEPVAELSARLRPGAYRARFTHAGASDERELIVPAGDVGGEVALDVRRP